MGSESLDTTELRVREFDGAVYVARKELLGSYAKRLTDRLEHWAENTPYAVAITGRTPDGAVRNVTWSDARAIGRQVAQALLNRRRLNEDRPVVALAGQGDGVDVSLLALGAMCVGIPYAGLSPSDLASAIETLTPGLIFAPGGLGDLPGGDFEVVTELPKAPATPLVDRFQAGVTPDTIVRFDATTRGGSLAFAVCTHRTLCSRAEIARRHEPRREGSGLALESAVYFGEAHHAASPDTFSDPLTAAWPVGHDRLPIPPLGIELKLVAHEDGKSEVRLKGPNVPLGYWRRPDLTRAAFDEEGYFKLGVAQDF